MMGVHMSGHGKLSRSFERLSKSIQRAVAVAVREGAEQVAREARAAIMEDSGGSMTQTDRERLAASVRVDEDGPIIRVGTDLELGAELEFGSQSAPARPWLQPALERVAPSVSRRIERSVRDAIRAAAKAA